MPQPFDQISGPRPMPLLGWRGNLLHIFSNPVSQLQERWDRYGALSILAQGGNTPMFTNLRERSATLFAFGSELAEAIYRDADTFQAGPFIGGFYPVAVDGLSPREARLRWVGRGGLFGVNGGEHRRQRQLIMPAFHRQRLPRYTDIIVSLTTRMIRQWRPGETIDVLDAMNQLTMALAGDLLFGLDFAPRQAHLGQLIQLWLQMTGHPIAQLWPADLPGLPYRRLLDATAALDHETRLLLAAKRSQPLGEDALSLLMTAMDDDGQPLSDEELIEHAIILYVAGHETTSNTLAWILFLLATHPEELARVDAELAAVCGGREPQMADLVALTYLDQVIKEGMRLFPAAPASYRIVAQETELGGYHLPAGCEIMLSIFHTHRDAAVYAQPQRFLPQRWQSLPSGLSYTHIPFGGGRRTCIGASLALFEIKLILATVLQQYHPQCPIKSKIDLSFDITLKPKNQLLLTLVPRGQPRSPAPLTLRGNIHDAIELDSAVVLH